MNETSGELMPIFRVFLFKIGSEKYRFIKRKSFKNIEKGKNDQVHRSACERVRRCE